MINIKLKEKHKQINEIFINDIEFVFSEKVFKFNIADLVQNLIFLCFSFKIQYYLF